MIFLGLNTDRASDRMQRFLTKLIDAEAHAGTSRFDALMAEAYELYKRLSDDERLWFDEKAEEIGRPTRNCTSVRVLPAHGRQSRARRPRLDP